MLVGYQAVFDASFEEAIRYAADHGLGFVQFDLNVPRFFLDELSPAELAAVRACAEDHGVRLSLHAPGDNISLFSDYPHVRRGIVEQLRLILERANAIGARHLTIHPGIPPSFRKADEDANAFLRDYHDHYVAVLRRNLQDVCAYAGSVFVCAENVGLMSLVMDALPPLLGPAGPLYLCWDIAKSRRQEDVEAFYTKHMEFLREVHVHDVDATGRQHRAVGDGVLRFGRFLHLLERRDVAVTMEVRPREAALRSVERLWALSASPDPPDSGRPDDEGGHHGR